MQESKFWLDFIANDEFQYDFAVIEGYDNKVLLPQPDHPIDPTIGARIVIGDYIRDFWCSTRLWQRGDYYQHWEESLNRLIFEGKENTALLTSLCPYTGKDTWEDVDFWVLVRNEEIVKCGKYNTTQLSYYMTYSKPLEANGLYEMVAHDSMYHCNEHAFATSVKAVSLYLSALRNKL
ncbi:hypothetical protein [Adonisia turfae]|uniref:Uncharacterized protein n=1 Tax=Adonisia turfae CCMR0081 TaxID=2292702 RepID=A0A6M0RXZ6_9CYAN|nr:hypothetical protein [Adonisia turfae]NEZ61054.1 hypothetical protein [Adonisia turfae CCMR0081]